MRPLGAPPSAVRAAEPGNVVGVAADLVAAAAPRVPAIVADVGDGASGDGVEAAAAVDGADGVALVLERLDGVVGAPAV